MQVPAGPKTAKESDDRLTITHYEFLVLLTLVGAEGRTLRMSPLCQPEVRHSLPENH